MERVRKSYIFQKSKSLPEEKNKSLEEEIGLHFKTLETMDIKKVKNNPHDQIRKSLIKEKKLY